jgi:hypothetical protein
MKNFERTNEYDDKLETNPSFNSKGIYTDDFSEKEVRLYTLEIIPKVGALS